ncbi:MAG TPA: pilus assembly protein TadG-related protein [Terracidiphilus sp.]
MKMLRDERGNVILLTALSLTMLLTFMAFAVDVGNFYYSQRQLQSIADAAAMAGALEINECGTGNTNCAVMQAAAKAAMTENGVTSYNFAAQSCPIAAATGTTINLTLNNGPCAYGSAAKDPNYGQPNYVEAVVTQKIPTYFARFIGIGTTQISARAEAGKGVPAFPTCGLASGGAGTDITVNGGGVIQDAAGSNCNVTSDSTSSGTCLGGTPSATINGSVTTNALNIVGNICDTNGGAVVPSSTNTGYSSVPDPFAGIAAPTPPAVTSTTGYGGFSGTSGSTYNFYPGTYTSNVNLNSGSYTVNFEPGLYYFEANVTFGNHAVTSTGGGVTFFFAPGANLTINTGVSSTLTAPAVNAQSDGSVISGTGAYNGLLIWQSSGPFDLDAGTTTTLDGAVYVPNGQLTVNGGATVNANGGFVAQSVMVDSTLTLSCTAMPNQTCAPGAGGGGGGGAAGGATTIALAE